MAPCTSLPQLIFVLITIISLTLYIYVFIGLLPISQENVSSVMTGIYLVPLSLCSSHLDQCFCMADPSKIFACSISISILLFFWWENEDIEALRNYLFVTQLLRDQNLNSWIWHWPWMLILALKQCTTYILET